MSVRSYGRIPSIAFCALRSFAEATSFIAEVIFSVLRTELIRSLTSRRDATAECYCVFWFNKRHRSAASCSMMAGAPSGILPRASSSRMS